MALYKNLRGDSSRLATQPFHDGYAYLTTNDGKFYIDAIDDDGNEKRILINKETAKAIIEINSNTEINLWIGTTEEYNALSEEEKINCLCITTDDLEEVSFENVSNKVTTIDENSNNVTYPTTLAIKNYISNIDGYEKTENKDLVISNASDDNHYPTSKAVYENVNNTVNSAKETILQTVENRVYGVEKQSNKVTEINEDAKHTTYPSSKAVYDAIKNVSNPNLLDNWHFGNPINQRGQTEYIASGYTIDRWTKHAQGSLSIQDDCVLLSGSDTNYANLRQYLEEGFSSSLVGHTVTFSVLTDKGLTYKTGIISDVPTVETGIFYAAIDVYGGIWLRWYTDGRLFVQIRATMNNSLKYYAAKLELGSQQTLAHQDENGNWVLNDPPPNKQQELAKCQRYFVGQLAYAKWTLAHVTYGGYLMIEIPLPVTLRSTSVSIIRNTHQPLSIYCSSGWTDISSIGFSVYCTGNSLYLSASSSAYADLVTLAAGMSYLTRGLPDVSADL